MITILSERVFVGLDNFCNFSCNGTFDSIWIYGLTLQIITVTTDPCSLDCFYSRFLGFTQDFSGLLSFSVFFFRMMVGYQSGLIAVLKFSESFGINRVTLKSHQVYFNHLSASNEWDTEIWIILNTSKWGNLWRIFKECQPI